MRQGSDILGKSVFAYDTGRTLESVRDLIFDHETNQVLGFLVAEAGWFKSARILPLSSIKAIGPSGIITADKSTVVPARTLARVKALLKENNVLRGTKIMTTDGRNLGTMVDVFFDETTGLVEGYEVSGGLFADAYSGRSFVPALQTLTIGEDVAFVVPETADLMEEQVGGVLGALQSAGDRLQEAGQYTGTKLQEATTYTGTKLQVAGQYTSEKLQVAASAAQKEWEVMTLAASQQYDSARRNAEVSITNAVISPEEQRAYALGKATQAAVVNDQGVVVISPSVVVTVLEVQQAVDNAVLDRLYRATGGDIGQEASNRIQAATQAAKEQFQLTSQQAQLQLQAATEQASRDLKGLQQDTLATVTNAAVDPKRQRTHALGKTVARDIYTLQGNLLIAEGAVVTTGVLTMADAAGVLDELYRATGGDIGAELTQQASDWLAKPAVEQTLGRRANSTVRTPSGLVIVAAGQIVTELVLDRAQAHHQEQALMVSTGLSLDEAYRQGASQGLLKTNERLRTTSAIAGRQLQTSASQLQSEAATLWVVCQRQARQVQLQVQQFIENRRIQGALGRPVTRVILDGHDQVILNVGDLITHKAIDRAREAGCLEILLGSVYNHTPELTRSDLRAPSPGEAALVRQG
ncbi:PRC-barrel domain-containing protein [Leptolyngbya sp. CCNP1308]|uniref:PRC-barrel domain-containing protein n=1 Tax=Leptolyngbya sp. CCNP1308 TaxID=3110255 RepID=UPI002B21F473|nr:PRC-barrel domain-containing protein [Leptolyngbya sp. CCNP1308]MEA5451060.1 PRC-barrel domain-containing protein [Leptolyngbya sp. CCNP1308]